MKQQQQVNFRSTHHIDNSVKHLPQLFDGVRPSLKSRLQFQRLPFKDGRGTDICPYPLFRLFCSKEFEVDDEGNLLYDDTSPAAADDKPIKFCYDARGSFWALAHPMRELAPISIKVCGTIDCGNDMQVCWRHPSAAAAGAWHPSPLSLSFSLSLPPRLLIVVVAAAATPDRR
jgi:hypothetical protein